MMILQASGPLLAAATLFVWCPPVPEEPFSPLKPGIELAWQAGPSPADVQPGVPPSEAAMGDKGPGVVGAWDPPTKWPVIAIHAAVLRSGKVLHYSYPGFGPGSRAELYDPATGNFTHVNYNTNIFCSGLSFLGDGSLYVTGGTQAGCDFTGWDTTHLFYPVGQSWTSGPVMDDGRWYPTNVTLGDGSVLIVSGLDSICETNTLIEQYVPGVGIVPLGVRNLQLYPRLHLLTSGLVAHVGPENWSYAFNPDNGLWQFIDGTNLGWRCSGTTVLIPGRTDQILAVGGTCPVTNTAEILDMTSANPQWQLTTSMHFARGHADALILPDKTIMVVGGGTFELYGLPHKVPEIFDPETESWKQVPPHVYGRMYHATTVLLPDGRVLVAGQDSGNSMFFGEIYNPPYLYRGERPELTAAPQRATWDRPFSLAVPDAASISAVAMIAPSTVTHSFNNSQRYVDLDFEVVQTGVIRATAPLNGNHAPPGYYMLFVVNEESVPAVAEFIRVGQWPDGDIDGDMMVGIVDFLLVLANWGPCAGCQADLNGDGEVGIYEFLLVLGNWS